MEVLKNAIFIYYLLLVFITKAQDRAGCTTSLSTTWATHVIHAGTPPLPCRNNDCVDGGFDWVVHPIPREDFFRDNWEERALYVQRDNAQYYVPYLATNLSGVEELLITQNTVSMEPALVHPGKGVSQADCTWVKQGMVDRKNEYHDVYEAYLGGCTIVCNIVPAYWPQLTSIMMAMEKELGFLFLSNLYLSPRNAQGFVAHTDNKDGFIIQVAGAKEWIMHETTFPRPTRSQTIGRPWEIPANDYTGKLLFNRTIRAGDMLHIPRGIIHYAKSASEAPSMHFTISSAKNLDIFEFLIPYVAFIFEQKETLTDLSNVFTNFLQTLVKDSSFAWLRTSLPRHYASLEKSDAILLVHAQIETTLRKIQAHHLTTNNPVVMNVCQLLLSLPYSIRHKSYEYVIEQQQIYPNYVHVLLSTASERYLRQSKSKRKALTRASAFIRRGALWTIAVSFPTYILVPLFPSPLYIIILFNFFFSRIPLTPPTHIFVSLFLYLQPFFLSLLTRNKHV